MRSSDEVFSEFLLKIGKVMIFVQQYMVLHLLTMLNYQIVLFHLAIMLMFIG